MIIKVLAFGIIKDIVGERQVALELSSGSTISDLNHILQEKYPHLAALNSTMVAINDEYAADSDLIHEGDEVALIPPVSGG